MQHQPVCVQVHGLSRSQIAAFRFHGNLRVEPASQTALCPWLIVDKDAMPSLSSVVNRDDWTYHSSLRHPADRDEDLTVFRRKSDQRL